MTYTRLHVLKRLTLAPSSLALSLPPTSTRQLQSLRPKSPSPQTKCLYRLFEPIVKCTACAPMTYSYTIFLISIGNLAKNVLWPCASVRTSISASCSDDKLIVDLRERIEKSDGVECDLMENGLRDFFGLDASCDGMSDGTQRTPGRRVKSLDFMVAIVARETLIVGFSSLTRARQSWFNDDDAAIWWDAWYSYAVEPRVSPLGAGLAALMLVRIKLRWNMQGRGELFHDHAWCSCCLESSQWAARCVL